MPRLRAIVAAILVLACLSGNARADLIRLMNGDEVRGEIVLETPAEVVVEFAKGRMTLSRAEVREIVRERAAEFWLAEGDHLYGLGSYDDAATLYRQALERDEPGAAGRLSRAERRLAERALLRGDLGDVEQRFRLALQAAGSDPETGDAETAAARAGLAQVRAVRARAQARMQEGLAALAARQWAKALTALDDAVGLDRSLGRSLATSRAQAASLEADRFAKAGDLARAAALFEVALSDDPSVATAIGRALATCRISLAAARLHEDDVRGAASILRDAVAIDPTSRLARFYLGLTLEAAGEPLEAVGEYRAALQGISGPVVVETGDDVSALRLAAARLLAPLPLDPARILDHGGWDRAEKTLQPAGQRGAFTIYSADAEKAARALDALEAAAPGIAAWVGQDALSVPITVYLFSSEADFRGATGEAAPVLGVTRTTTRRGHVDARRIYSWLTAPRLLEDVLPHELTHAMTAEGGNSGGLPLWLSEGLACSSETDASQRARVASHKANIEAGRDVPLSVLLALRGYPGASDVGDFYSGGTAVALFLAGQGGRDKLLAFGRRLADGPIESMLSDAYGVTTVAELQRQIDAWLGAKRPGG